MLKSAAAPRWHGGRGAAGAARLVAFAFAFPLLVSIAGCRTSKPPKAPPKLPKRPIALRLPKLGGGVVDVASFRGRPLVVFVFTTWSLRSQAEAPRINALAQRFEKRGLAVIGISIDRGARQLVETYVDFVKFRFPVAWVDPENLELVGALGITHRVPRTLLLDRAGRVVQDYRVGQTDLPRLTAGIERLLARRPAPAASSPASSSTPRPASSSAPQPASSSAQKPASSPEPIPKTRSASKKAD